MRELPMGQGTPDDPTAAALEREVERLRAELARQEQALAAARGLGEEHARARAEAERRAAELEPIFAAMSEAVVVYDVEGNPIRANEVAAVDYGISLPPMGRDSIAAGLAVREPGSSGTRPATADELPSTRALRGEPVTEQQFLFRDPQGRERLIAASAAPLRCRGRVCGAVAVWREVTDRERLIEQLEAERALWRATVESLPNPVTIGDAEGHATYVNAAYTRLLGRQSHEGIPVEEHADHYRIYHHDGTLFEPRDLPLQRAATDGVDVRDVEIVHRTRDGRERVLLVNASPLRDRDGRVVGAVAVGSDVTAERRATAEREDILAELRGANDAKDRFIGMMSHELRNPLAAITSATHLFRMKPPDDPMLLRAADVLERQSRHMARLVDDLLDVSRVTHGKISLHRRRVDLVAIARQVAGSDNCPMLRGRGHHLGLSLPSEPIWLAADPARLEQVLSNLLDNAAKYTPPGGHVSLMVAREGDEAVVRVRDDGVGISADLLPRIFEPFVQADQSLDRSQGGLGLGLTLVKSLVTMHGGTIEAHSAGLGLGSEFVLRLPAPDSGNAGVAEGEATVRAVPTARRILVVEDQRDVADMLAATLEGEGHAVCTAYDGPAALDAAASFRPDVVLLDLAMPGMGGIEVARRIRQDRSLGTLFLVALTGHGQAEDREMALAAGFDAHLTKPAGVRELTDLLAAVRASR